SPIACTATGYAVFSRQEAEPALRQDFPISTYHIPASVSPYLAERTAEPLLTRHGPAHAHLRRILTRILRARVLEALRPEIGSVFANLLEPLLGPDEVDL